MSAELEQTPRSWKLDSYIYEYTHIHTHTSVYNRNLHIAFQKDSRNFLSHKQYMRVHVSFVHFPKQCIIIHFYLYYFNQRKMLTQFCFNLHFSANEIEHFITLVGYLQFCKLNSQSLVFLLECSYFNYFIKKKFILYF